ncbi:hypothetical protein [Georgenia faecalis]|uniref:Replicase polyprotein 1ab n=1 Tax=Georgenia faecalis TaxID=2483799 RepID=A0ABV9DF74_9MICO|nr:hypothetical protein [Georgenia faecalis]
MLDRAARKHLRSLSKDNADGVAQHLVMAGRLIDVDPELAYAHAQSALRRAARIDIVREAVALTAYATERYAEALRELRTVRRLSGVDAYRAMEADCERGLGRPERALSVLAEAPAPETQQDRVELAIVASGARTDLGEHEAALSVLERAEDGTTDRELLTRLALVRADVLVALGRSDEAAALRESVGGVDVHEDVFVTDLLSEAEDGEIEDLSAAQDAPVDETERVDETDETDEIDEAEPDEAEPVDEADEAEPVAETEETERVDETDEADEAEPVGEIDEIDEAEPVGEAVRVDEADEADEIDEAEPVDETDEVQADQADDEGEEPTV